MYVLGRDSYYTLVVLAIVVEEAGLDQPPRPARPLVRLAIDHLQPIERLYELYTVYAVDVYVAGVGFQHVALSFRLLGSSLSS